MTEPGHQRSVVVWDVPSTVVCGTYFTISVGAKCESGCQPRGWRLEVRDHGGTTIATAAVTDRTWPGTEGLFRAQIELVSPETEGLFGWQVVALADEPAAAADETEHADHGEVRAGFSLRTVAEADFKLTVVAVDREREAPVSGAKVVVHPYRALTDEHGVATLSLPRGQYRLFVSRRDFRALRLDGELASDTTLRAVLEPDVGISDAELWA